MQSSIAGNARTAIICTMSPARSHVEQTRNTLLFASCAKEVATNAKVNVVMTDKLLVKQLQRELARLEGELRNSGSTNLKSISAALLKEKDLQIEMVIMQFYAILMVYYLFMKLSRIFSISMILRKILKFPYNPQCYIRHMFVLEN